MPEFELKSDNGKQRPQCVSPSDAYKTPSDVSNIPKQPYMSWPKIHL